MKIANKISLSFLILTVLFSAILTTAFYTIARDNLEDSIYSSLKVVAQSRADTVETFLDSGKETIRQLSKSIVIEELLLTDRKNETYRQRLEDVMRRLKSTAGIMKYTYGIFVLNRNGVVVASSEPADIGKDKSGDPYYLEGRKGAYIKDAYTSHTRKVGSIAFSAPVYDESNTRLLGVVVSRVYMTSIDGILEKSSGLGETEKMYLINRNGYMITPSRSMKDTFLKLKVDTQNSRAALKHFTDPHEKQVEHKPSGSMDYRRIPVLGAHAIILEMRWCLLAEINESDALAPLEKLAAFFMIIFLLIPLAAWPAGRFVARIIAGPLHKLHEGTEIIGTGNLDYKVGTDSQDEIGQLSRAFDEMTEHLKETTTSIDELHKEVDERQQAEKALRQEKNKAQRYLDIAGVIFVVIDADQNVSLINKKGCEISGYTQEEITGRNWFDMVIPEKERDVVKDVFTSLMAGEIETTEYYENHLLTQKGPEKIIAWHNTVLSDEKGSIIGTLASGEDITDRKKTEKALQKSEETFRAISATANDGIIMMDTEGKVTYWNRAAEKIFGYTGEEILGKELHTTLTPERFLEAHKKGFARFKTTGQGAAIGETLELAAVKKDGTEIPVDLSLASVKIDGEWNAVGLIRDITNRKLAEKALQKSKREAEDANLAKTEFLASMSHEIRTPMNAIIGMADLLQETRLDTEQKQYVQTFQSAGENLLNIINDILDISKVEAGQIQLETTDFNLNEMIENICEVMAIRAHEKGLELTYNIMPNVPTDLLGDPVRLRQILINLMGNAIKFTGKGEVDVQVERQGSGIRDQGSEDGEVGLVFSVTDTGIGIPPDKINTIFEVFTQADSSTTRKYGGTGLGLSISKKLVELMDGNLQVESEPGHGSTFSFAAGFGVQKIPSGKTESLPVDLKGFSVLVVDDNATNRLILSKFLSGLGAIVTEAEDGEHGLAEFKRALETADPFQLALIDGRMPGMDGFELAGQIKEKTGGIRDTAIMMLTSDDRRDDIARCRELDISTYLVKPVKRNDLLDAIAVILGRKAAPPTGRVPEVKPVDFSKVRPFNILLVEDSADNRLLIQAYFKRSSDHIEIAENGEIAVKKFKSGKYDIVLMDVQMPIMDGYTATGEIRKWEEKNGRKKTPIIALTAHAMAEDFQKSLDAGCTDHLTKPIKKATLMETIQKYAVKEYGNTDS